MPQSPDSRLYSLGTALLVSSVIIGFLVLGRGNALVPALVPAFGAPFAAVFLLAQVGLCAAHKFTRGYVVGGVTLLVAAPLMVLGNAFGTRSAGLALTGFDRIATGSVLLCGVAVGWAARKGATEQA
jgi:hypothetical protein